MHISLQDLTAPSKKSILSFCSFSDILVLKKVSRVWRARIREMQSLEVCLKIADEFFIDCAKIDRYKLMEVLTVNTFAWGDMQVCVLSNALESLIPFSISGKELALDCAIRRDNKMLLKQILSKWTFSESFLVSRIEKMLRSRSWELLDFFFMHNMLSDGVFNEILVCCIQHNLPEVMIGSFLQARCVLRKSTLHWMLLDAASKGWLRLIRMLLEDRGGMIDLFVQKEVLKKAVIYSQKAVAIFFLERLHLTREERMSLLAIAVERNDKPFVEAIVKVGNVSQEDTMEAIQYIVNAPNFRYHIASLNINDFHRGGCVHQCQCIIS